MRLLSALLCASMLTMPQSVHASETITLAADNWCPYTCEKGDKPGYMVEIAETIFAAHDIKVHYEVMSWTRAIEFARTKKINGIIGAAKGDAPDFVFPSATQGLSSMQFWTRKDSRWSFDSIASLGKVRIGVITDYSYGYIVDLYLKTQQANKKGVQYVTGDNALELNLRKLSSNVIDVTLEDKSVMHYYHISRNLPLAVRAAGSAADPGKISDNFLYIAFGPNTPKASYYAALIGQGMRDLRDSGKLAKILAKYGVEDWYSQTRQ